MIIYIDIPFTTPRLRPALKTLFSNGACVFVSGDADAVATVERARKEGAAILCGPITLDTALRISEGDTIATFIGRPEPRIAAAWRRAIDDPSDPDHSDAQTLRPLEALLQNRPFAARHQNGVLSALSPQGAAPSVEAVLARLGETRSIVGWASHPRAFASALETATSLGDGAIERAVFEVPLPQNSKGPFGTVVRQLNKGDIALLKALPAAAAGGRTLVSE